MILHSWILSQMQVRDKKCASSRELEVANYKDCDP